MIGGTVLIFSPHLKRATSDRFPPVLYDDQDLLFDNVCRLLGKRDAEVAVFHQGGQLSGLGIPKEGGCL